MRQALLAAAALVLIASPIRAQRPISPAPVTSSTSARFEPTLAQAFASLDRREFAGAHQVFTEILHQSALSPAERARALRGLGTALFQLNRRLEAAKALAQALDAATAVGNRSEQAWARRWIGALHYGDGRADQARAMWSGARDDFVASGDTRGEFQVLSDLALLVQGLEQRPLVERCYAIALEQHDPLLEARARRRWGQALLEAARPGAALIELERAVALMRPLDAESRSYLGDALAILGWALRAHGAPDRAVPVHREAIRMARAAGDLNAQMWNYHGLGIALAESQRYPEAEVAMGRGLDAARKTGSATDIRLLTESAGWIALMRKDWRHAAAALESMIALPGVEVTATPLVHLARAYRELHRLDDALATANRGAELARRLGMVDNELRALIEVAQTQEAQTDLDVAQQTLSGVIERLEAYRAELAPVDFLKQGFGDRFSDAYAANVALLVRRDRPAEALAAAERLRSRAFADLLATRRSREAEDAEAASGAWALGGRVTPNEPSSAPADSLRMLPAMDSAGLVALADRLSTTLVLYWIHERGSFAWVVNGNGAIHAFALQTTPGAVREAVGRASDTVPDVTIKQSSSNQATAVVGSRTAYRSLYDMVWAPLERWLPTDPGARITIVPHGPLFALPFGALLDRQGRYVVERYALHYAASGAVLADAATGVRLPAPAGARALLVADPQPLPVLASGVQLPPLTSARAEARAIGPMFTTEANMLTGSHASEAAVRAALPEAHVVHFATHALVNESDPLGSHLILATSGAGGRTSDRDGRLTASEVAGLSLRADLVVLGACRSARGSLSSDGIAGLTRAFMAAGAPSVIATLWDVSDQATARILIRFYRGYLAGESKDRALRAAQLALLRDLRAGRVKRRVGETTLTYGEHPHLWAGPILIGAPSR